MAPSETKADEKHFETEEAGAQVATPTTMRPVGQSLRLWARAVGWCGIISLAVIMESYSSILLNSFYASPEFTQAYGTEVSPGVYEISSAWQSGINAGMTACLIVGVALGGPFIDRFGHRITLIGGLILNIAFIFITFFAKSIGMIAAGVFLCALPWGCFSVLAPGYAIEVLPMELRGYGVSYVNLCWVMGHLISAGVQKGTVSRPDEWSYRIPFAVQWAFMPIILIPLVFAPDSPYFLVRRGRMHDAVKALGRLHAPDPSINDEQIVADIAETARLETELKVGGSYPACFKRINLRRTEIATVAWTSQALVGFAIQFYTTLFFTQAGLDSSDAFSLGLGSYAIAFCGTVGSWFLQARLGRRTIYLAGMLFMTPLMWVVSLTELGSSSSAQWAQASCLIIWFAFYGSTNGPIAYVIAAESSAVKLRAKTLSIARSTYYVFYLIAQVLAPYMIQTWNLGGFTALPAAIMSTILIVWTYFRLPEMKGRSFDDLDVLFFLGIPARKFKSYRITQEDKARFHKLHSEEEDE